MFHRKKHQQRNIKMLSCSNPQLPCPHHYFRAFTNQAKIFLYLRFATESIKIKEMDGTVHINSIEATKYTIQNGLPSVDCI